MKKKIASAWGLSKPHAVRQAQEIVLSLDQELCPRLWCRTWRWYFRHVILALIIVMDGRDLKAHQPCHYSHFVLQKILSKTADQQNDSASAGLDFDMCTVFWNILGKGQRRHILALSSFDWMSTRLSDFWFLLWIDYQMVRYRNDPQILLLPLCFIRVCFEIMEDFS